MIISIFYYIHRNIDYRKCWSNEFTCKNLECVRPAYICDGEPKCLDGSDEENCSEGKWRVS